MEVGESRGDVWAAPVCGAKDFPFFFINPMSAANRVF